MVDRNPKVLVVEGESLARTSLGELFHDEGYAVEVAAHAAAALACLESNPRPNVILIDLYTPGWRQLLERARQAAPGALILTMGNFDTHAAEAETRRLGAHEHFDKPLLFTELHRRIGELLRRHAHDGGVQ